MAREQDTLNQGDGVTSDQIRRDINRTRAEMDQTVDQLGNRLRPRHLLDEVLDYFNSGESNTGVNPGQQLRSTANTVISRLKDHPMPAVLIGAGIAWLFMEGDAKSRTRLAQWDRAGRRGDIGNWRNLPEHGGSVVDARTGEPYDEATYGRGADYGQRPGSESVGYGQNVEAGHAWREESSDRPGLSEKAREKFSSAAGIVGDKASSIGESISGAAQSAKEGLSSAAGTVGQYARGAGTSTREYGSQAYDYAGRGYQTAKNGIVDAMEEYPLISGVAALALGAVAGLILPATRRENELMGEYSDQVKDKVQQAGEQVYEQGKAVATAATSVVTDAASEKGLDSKDALLEKGKHVATDVGNAVAGSASKLIDDVKQMAQDATQAFSESSRREGLAPDQLKEAAKDVAVKAKDAAKEQTQHKSM